MLISSGDIWSFTDHYIVIPTNIGWKKTGLAVMGAGLAKDAAQYYPDVLPWYGGVCETHKASTPVVLYPSRPLIFFPTKPLSPNEPHLSWKNPASLALIESRLPQLVELGKTLNAPVAVPLLGCGMGGLDPAVVTDLCKRHLDDKFRLVTP